jgi:hypothetical protein
VRQIEHDKLVLVVTDGGWDALIRKNGHATWNVGHYEHTTNNAMEIRAVAEAMHMLPVYVKNGVTRRMWARNGRKTSQGHTVANITLWPWVKAHSGLWLNECEQRAKLRRLETHDSTWRRRRRMRICVIRFRRRITRKMERHRLRSRFRSEKICLATRSIRRRNGKCRRTCSACGTRKLSAEWAQKRGIRKWIWTC